MYAFSLGIARVGGALPDPVYALLSGLNAATVGIIALAAVQLAKKAITDKLTRALVFLGGAAGVCYTALWYFPVLMAVAGLSSVVWDSRILHSVARRFRRKSHDPEASPGHEDQTVPQNVSSQSQDPAEQTSTPLRRLHPDHNRSNAALPITSSPSPSVTQVPSPAQDDPHRLLPSWSTGILMLVAFFLFFLTLMLLRGLLRPLPRPFSLYANLNLAGTIIFGGGPVVIPLLREYVVAEGWVSPRDFLLGLALIQAFPGPNFNFAVYLGALSLAGTGTPTVVGALLAYMGIFFPGILVQTGFMGIWGKVRKNRMLLSGLRGVNAGAVGLVFTAVYRLWRTGVLDKGHQAGTEFGPEPWFVVIVATSFVGGWGFGLSPPGAIVLGGTMGLCWWGAVGRFG